VALTLSIKGHDEGVGMTIVRAGIDRDLVARFDIGETMELCDTGTLKLCTRERFRALRRQVVVFVG
jgi:hypothetical protein